MSNRIWTAVMNCLAGTEWGCGEGGGGGWKGRNRFILSVTVAGGRRGGGGLGAVVVVVVCNFPAVSSVLVYYLFSPVHLSSSGLVSFC